MAIKNNVLPITLRSQSAALFTGNFVVVNAPGLTQPCFFIRINNATNRDVFLSFDGVTEHEFLSAGQVLELSTQTNSQPSNYVALFSSNTKIYVKTNGGAGTGALYISGWYQPQGA